MHKRFGTVASRIIGIASAEARKRCHNQIASELILLAILRERESLAFRILRGANIDLDLLKIEIEKSLAEPNAAASSPPTIPFAAAAKQMIDHAGEISQQVKHQLIGSGHMLAAMVSEGNTSRVFLTMGVDLKFLYDQSLQSLKERSEVEVPIPALSLQQLETAERLSDSALKAISRAASESSRLKSDSIRAEHILDAMLSDPETEAAHVIASLAASPSAICRELEQRYELGTDDAIRANHSFSPEVKHSMALAGEIATASGDNVVSTHHFLQAFLQDDRNGAGEVLRKCGVTLEMVRDSIRKISQPEPKRTTYVE